MMNKVLVCSDRIIFADIKMPCRLRTFHQNSGQIHLIHQTSHAKRFYIHEATNIFLCSARDVSSHQDQNFEMAHLSYQAKCDGQRMCTSFTTVINFNHDESTTSATHQLKQARQESRRQRNTRQTVYLRKHRRAYSGWQTVLLSLDSLQGPKITEALCGSPIQLLWFAVPLLSCQT